MRRRDPKTLFLRYLDRGDARALGRAYDALAPELLALALHLTRRLDLAEDALQETFLRALEKGHRFDRSRALMPWLVGILVNAVRKQSGHSFHTRRSGEATGNEPAPGPDPAATAASSEIAELVDKEIGGLAEPYQAVVAAHLGQGLPPRDIAASLGRAPGTVRVQLHRGLEMLRGRLADRGAHAESVLGRMAAVGFVPGGADLAGAKLASLETVRGSVMVKAELAAASGEVAAGPGLSTATLWVAGAVMAAAGTLFLWFQGTGAAEPAIPTLETARAASEERATVPSVELRLDPPAERRAPAAAAPAPKAPASPTLASAKKNEPSPGRQRPGRQRPDKNAAEPVQAWVVPEVDVSALRNQFDTNGMVLATLKDTKGEVLGAAVERFAYFDRVPMGNVRGLEGIPEPVILRFDHPDALPVEVTLLKSHFRQEGGPFVARPLVRLQPVENHIEVLFNPLDESEIYRHFSGTLIAIRVDRGRGVWVEDVQTVRPGDRETVRLRIARSKGSNHVVAVPDHAPAAPSAKRIKRMRKGVIPITLTSFVPFPQLCEIKLRDPFGDVTPYTLLKGQLLDDVRLHDERPGTSGTFEFEGLTLVDIEAISRSHFFSTRVDQHGALAVPLELEASPTGGEGLIAGYWPELYSLTASSPWYPYGALPLDRAVPNGRHGRLEAIPVTEVRVKVAAAGIEALLTLSPDDRSKLQSGAQSPPEVATLVAGGTSKAVPVRALPMGNGWRLRLLAPPLTRGVLRVDHGGVKYAGPVESTAPGKSSAVVLTPVKPR